MSVKGVLFDEGVVLDDTIWNDSGDPLTLRCRVDDSFSLESFKGRLSSFLAVLGYEVFQLPGSGDDGRDALSLVCRPRGGADDESLRIILTRRPLPLDITAPPKPGQKPRLAIIIDDLGIQREAAEKTVNLPFHVTMSIMPHQPASEYAAAMAARAGREVLMHVPMEPVDYPDKDPGRGALMSGMDDDQINRIMEENLRSVPGAVGINNHMGSRLTSDQESMDNLMKWMVRYGLIFLDSRTSNSSVAYEMAKLHGIKSSRRDIFLDNSDDPAYISDRLDELIDIALARGTAVGIGHPRESTLSVLEKSRDRFEKAGVEVVPLSGLIR